MEDQAFTLRKLLLNNSKKKLPEHCFAIIGNFSKIGYYIVKHMVAVCSMHKYTSTIIYTNDEFPIPFGKDGVNHIGFSKSNWLDFLQAGNNELFKKKSKFINFSVDYLFMQIPMLVWPIILHSNQVKDVIWIADPSRDSIMSIIHGINSSTGVDKNIRHHVILTSVCDDQEAKNVFDSLVKKFNQNCACCIHYAGWLSNDTSFQSLINENLSIKTDSKIMVPHSDCLLKENLSRLITES